jgi:isopenicillin-N epimerase
MRAEFDTDPQTLYFHAANQSISPRCVRQAIPRYHEEYERNPSVGMAQAWGRLWESQRLLAGLVGARAQDCFLRANVTAVLNQFLLGIALPEGSEILAGELEYGAIVNIARLRALRDRLRLRLIRMPGSLPALRRLDPEQLADRVVSAIGPRTRLVLLSHVVGGIGLVMPIEKIARETRRRGCLLVVDGAYAPGALDVDFGRLGDIDFYGCSLYKWLLGPKGTAFGWVAPRNQATLTPTQAGWLTFGSYGPFSAFGGGDRFQETFLMPGCHDFAPFFAIADTIDFWQRHTPGAVRDRMNRLRGRVESRLSERLGWRQLAPDHPALRGPIAAFRVPDAWQKEGPRLQSRLLAECGVQIGTVLLQGQWLVSISPHVYNDETEIEQMVARFERWRP